MFLNPRIRRMKLVSEQSSKKKKKTQREKKAFNMFQRVNEDRSLACPHRMFHLTFSIFFFFSNSKHSRSSPWMDENRAGSIILSDQLAFAEQNELMMKFCCVWHLFFFFGGQVLIFFRPGSRSSLGPHRLLRAHSLGETPLA